MAVYMKRNRFQLKEIPYEVLNYLKATGTQYINTGYKLTSNNVKIVCEFTLNAIKSGTSMFGGQESGSFTIVPYCNGSAYSFYLGTTNGVLSITLKANTKYTMECSAKNGTLTVTINGTKYTASYSGTLNKNVPLTIFSNYMSGSPLELSSMQYNTFKLYDNDKLVRDYIAAKEKTTQKIGMWEMINNILYENAGTGSFVGG